MPDIGDFIRRSRRLAKIAIAAPGTPGDFRRSPRSAYKIAKCVAGLREPMNFLLSVSPSKENGKRHEIILFSQVFLPTETNIFKNR